MSTTRAESAPSRRQEIIATALELLAEEGYAGASLRKLAARLGIAQPSLYHYFRTKEELVEQVLATYAGQMFFSLDPSRLPKRLEEVPRFIVGTALRVYERPSHASFVRVAISVSRTHERFGTLMRRAFVDQATWGIQQIMRPFVEAGELSSGEALDLVRLLLNAIGLRLIEDQVMFAAHEPGPDFDRFVEFVVQVGETWVEARRARGPSPAD
ncbi:TetR/AcrR family transcriptional regulator [Paraliomyxa miuraensis]|uniref:TetR/AcrR family transcriptional regulator n=1 Tax=Paraliomyxa miuraensis TaxID=376150 RepID=UPI0022505915|nr:TetR/AcrR family transcriptional regulator [Paraliomyxa miuraensis]MCX4247284.1 TetR/AcrR family transcriptional regulator [Paraliomyxa miuraensis]